MLYINKPEGLMTIANKMFSHESDLTYLEAKIILGYLEGSDYSLLYYYGKHRDQHFVIHDNQDTDEGSGEKCHSLSSVIEKASDLCYDILENARRDDSSTQDYIDILERDEYILNRVYLDYEE